MEGVRGINRVVVVLSPGWYPLRVGIGCGVRRRP